MARDYHKEARKVKRFDTSVIPELSSNQKAWLKDYNRRSDSKKFEDKPSAAENKKYFMTVMLQNANRFKFLASMTPNVIGLRKVKKNYEDNAEANYNAYLALKK